MIVGFQLFKDQFNDPAGAIGLNNLYCGQLFGRDVGDVEVVALGLGIILPDDPEPLGDPPSPAFVGPPLKADFDLDIDDVAFQIVQDRLELLPYDGSCSAPADQMFGDNGWIAQALQPTDEIATEAIDAVEQGLVEIAQIEQQQSAFDPGADGQSPAFVSPFRGQFDALWALAQHAED